jgi:hypothetical protein
MKDIHNTTRPVLKKFRYVDGSGTDCTVFLGLSEEEWSAFVSDGAKNLEPLRGNIMLMVRGREATSQEQADARAMFDNIFHSITPEPRDKVGDPGF